MKLSLKFDKKKTGTLHKDLWTIISCRNVWNEERYRQKLQTKSNHTFCVQQCSSENRADYEIMWKSMVEPDRPQATIQHGVCSLHGV